TAVELKREIARRPVVDRPGGTDEVCDAAREERLGETRRERRRARLGPVRCDSGFAGVREDEFRDAVYAAQFVSRQTLAAGEDPPRSRGVFRVIKAVTGEVKDIVRAATGEVKEYVVASRLGRAEQGIDFNAVFDRIIGL